jgi:NH3-dependent NAD+ synthetase
LYYNNYINHYIIFFTRYFHNVKKKKTGVLIVMVVVISRLTILKMLQIAPYVGLWHGQTDEQELKLIYGELDRILTGLERKMDIDDIAKIVRIKKSEVVRVKNMRIKNQYKRRTLLIPKVGLRTPGLDWRSPVQEG